MNLLLTTANWPPWGSMWGTAIAIYGSLKVLSWRHRRTSSAPVWKHVAYLIAWPGMDADAFLSPTADVRPVSTAEWIFAFSKLTFGCSLLMFAVSMRNTVDALWQGWIGLIGLGFVLHFGVFHLLSCVWRTNRLSAMPLMNWPIASQSLAEFWGRRWNLAFRDLTHRLIFRPLRHGLTPAGALLVGFLVSGLIHDVVISWPVDAGYGMPTAYFLCQGAGVVAERSRFGKWIGLGRGLRGRLFCVVTLLAPVGWLFHRQFVCGVIVPFLRITGDWL